jgi:NAD(P)-dependent dehydrogenase (short-subunit alcohol dehydrogenase family)
VLPLRAYTREKMESAYAINVHAGAMLAKGLRQKGVAAETASLVLLASVAAFTGDSALGIYSGTKGALVAMCRSLAVELASQKIRVNCLAPGLVRTEMAEALSERTGADQYAAIEALHPLGLGNPDDVACAVTYLLSPAARWITGTTLVIDGGYTAR